MDTTPKGTISNVQKCPVCGSDMKRDGHDNHHNLYVGNYTCTNQQCTVSATFRN